MRQPDRIQEREGGRSRECGRPSDGDGRGARLVCGRRSTSDHGLPHGAERDLGRGEVVSQVERGRRRKRRDDHLGGETIRLIDELDAVTVVPRVGEHRLEVGFPVMMGRHTTRQRSDERSE
jgi:hypothetical protein